MTRLLLILPLTAALGALLVHSHAIPTSDEHERSNARTKAEQPYGDLEPPHIPYALEQTPSFRELMAWYDEVGVAWITRKQNYLVENLFRKQMTSDPFLLDYFLNPENSGFLYDTRTYDEPPRQSKGRERREIQVEAAITETPNELPYCSGAVRRSNTEQYMKEPVELPRVAGETTPGCRLITDALLSKVSLICDSKNITSMPILPPYLDIFEMNGTSAQVVTPHSFWQKTVPSVRMNLNDLMYVDPLAFAGIQSTRYLQMMHNKLTWIWFEDSFYGLDDVISLQLDFNEISLEGVEELCVEKADINDITPVLPSLLLLSLRQNPLNKIPRTFFAPLRNSKILNLLLLGDCQLEEIHPEALSFLPYLKTLDLSANPVLMQQLPTSFQGLNNTKLTQLDLSKNALITPPKKALELVAHTLSTLDMQNNIFTTLGRDSFPENMLTLKNLNLDSCSLKSLENGVFNGMTNLEVLMLKNNHFRQVPAPIGSLVSLRTLDLSENILDPDFGTTPFEFPPNIFQDLVNLQILTLSRTWISTLRAGDLKGLDSLEMLYLDGCKITIIEDFVFDDVKALTILNLNMNYDLRQIMANTFYGLANLRTLYLNWTGLSFIDWLGLSDPDSNPSHIDFVTTGGAANHAMAAEHDHDDEDLENLQRPFMHLSRIQYLYLHGNRMRRLHPRLFGNLPHLRLLDLGENEIEAWETPVFANATALLHLYLDGNELYTVSDAMLEDFDGSLTGRKTIDLSDNDFACDAGVCQLKAETEEEKIRLNKWDVHGYYQCRLLLNDGSIKIEISNLFDETCRRLEEEDSPPITPPTTTSTTPAPNGTTPSGPNAGTPPTAPSTLPTTTDHTQSNTRSDKGFSLPTSAVALSGCLFAVFCLAGLAYWRKEDVYFLWFGARVSVLKKMRISGKRLMGGREDAYEYDVFISYSHCDSEFIQDTLVPQLEGNGNFIDKNVYSADARSAHAVIRDDLDLESCSTCSSTRAILESEAASSVSSASSHDSLRLCLHVRDFQVGAPITDNIIECVDRSRKVLIVVSKKYLESQWCLFEMNLAYHRLIEARRASFVLILLEDIPLKARTKVLAHLMKSRTYLEFPKGGRSSAETHFQHVLFWKRLKAALAAEKDDS